MSPEEVDFGILGPEDAPTREVIVTDPTGGSLSVHLTCNRSWLTVADQDRRGADIVITVRADGRLLPTRRRDTAELTVRAAGASAKVRVAAKVVPGGAGGSGARGSSSSRAKPTTASPCAPFLGRSFIISAAVLALLFAAALSVMLLAARQPEAAGLAPMFKFLEAQTGLDPEPVAAALLVALYATAAIAPGVYRSLLGRVPPSSTQPNHRRLLKALESACRSLAMSPPRVVLRNDPLPNACAGGVPGLWTWIQVNSGLVATLTDDDHLAAALTHELAHIRRGDALLVALLGPPISLARRVYGLARNVLGGFGKTTRAASGMGCLPLLLLGRMPKFGCMGFLIGAMVFMYLAMVAAVLASYIGGLVGVLVGFGFGCLIYIRRTEFEADRAAAQALGSADPLIYAMLCCVDAYPEDAAVGDGVVSAVTGMDISRRDDWDVPTHVRSIQSASPDQMPRVRERLGRSMPFVAERIARLIQAFGTRIA